MDHKGIDFKQMTVSYPRTVGEFHERAKLLSDLYPFSVHGGGRTPKYNKKVGGVEDSWHIMWMALDGICTSSRDDERGKNIQGNGPM